MSGLIHGMDVVLYTRTASGTDAFNNPVFTESSVTVENVLVSPATGSEVTDTLRLYGKRLCYTLGIPKGDNHSWEDCRVRFFDRDFHVFGPVLSGVEDLMPLDWHKKVMVEAYE